MKGFKRLQNFSVWYKTHYVMPKEFLPDLKRQNIKNTIIISYLLFLIGTIGILYLELKYKARFAECRRLFHYFCYYILCSIIGITWGKLTLKSKTNNIFILSLPILFVCFSCVTAVGINFFILKNYVSTFMQLSILSVVLVVLLNLEPMYYVVVVPFIVITSLPITFKYFGPVFSLEVIILGVVVIWLSYYTRWLAKKEQIDTFILKNDKEILKNEVEYQLLEIQEKEEELTYQQNKIIEIQNNTIIGLSNLVENRDSDTGEHVRRTAAYVGIIAEQLFKQKMFTDIINPHYIELLIKAAPMHDIGKIVVPDIILKKPGKLTAEEFKQIKRHTTEGGRIIKEILGTSTDTEYVTVATEISEGHHEKWDGTGYPYNKKGDSIPLSARIMAIADVFDALVSPRCYKEPISIDKAFEILKAGCGNHFDPDILPEFLKLRPEIELILERYKDKN